MVYQWVSTKHLDLNFLQKIYHNSHGFKGQKKSNFKKATGLIYLCFNIVGLTWKFENNLIVFCDKDIPTIDDRQTIDGNRYN